MRSVTGQEYPANAEVFSHPHVDPVERDPAQVVEFDIGTTGATVKKRLNLGEGEVWNLIGGNIGNELAVIAIRQVP